MTAVLFIGETGYTALTYYRTYLPGESLRRAGWTVWKRSLLIEREDHRLVGWDGLPGEKPTPVASVVVVRHLIDPRGAEASSAEMFRSARAAGQRVFYDLDDDVWNLDPTNPAAGFYDSRQLAALEANLDAVDGVLVSTPGLAAAVRTHTDTPVHVCPNGIDVADFRLHTLGRPLRVGWFGYTAWRGADVVALASWILPELAAHANRISFAHAGAVPGSPRLADLLGVGDDFQVIEHPAVDFERLPDLLDNIDLAVLPMVNNAQNRARSATTGMALAASGIPFVASATPAYLELADSHRGGGIWLGWGLGLGAALGSAIETYLRDPGRWLADSARLRADMATRAEVGHYWEAAFDAHRR